MKKRELFFIFGLLIALFLLTACNTTEQELDEPQPLVEPEMLKVDFSLEHPAQVSLDEVFDVKVTVTNNLDFPVTLSSITFPFSDFKFVDEGFATNPDVNIAQQEVKVLEYKIQKNLEDDLGDGKMVSLMQFDLEVDDPAGSRDVSKREDFVIEFI